VGGAVGRHQRWRGHRLRLPATAVAPAIERLLRSFLGARRPTETFPPVRARHTDDELRALLAGELSRPWRATVAAERPPARSRRLRWANFTVLST